MMRYRQSSIVVTLAAVLGLSGIVSAAPTIAADESLYYLPAPAETALVVSRGNGDTDGRSVRQDYAFDFVAADEPERFRVVAARGGTVIGTRVGLRGGRCTEPLGGRRPACWRDVNYVLIDHGDGTSALYTHLRRREPLVRRGDVVSVGQPIGVAGSSGWTDEVGLGFQLQVTPTWNEAGRGGWFLTESIPLAFADPDVVSQRVDGVPQADDEVISGNPGAGFEPFRFHHRPTGLPASVPFEDGVERDISMAYQADSSDGYGLHFAAPIGAVTDTLDPGFIPGTAVRPLFGGNLEFAGCASGGSASLGRIVVTGFEVDGTPYHAVHGHLSYIEPALLDPGPGLPSPIVGPDDVIGYYGVNAPLPEDQTLDCPEADSDQFDLFVTILRDATVSSEGEVSGGTPVSPEPLVGERGYEGFDWFTGPVAADEVVAEPGRPRARWHSKTPAHSSHIVFGDTVTLRARVRDVSDIAQVRFRAYYPRWPQVDASSDLTSFDPITSWRQLAVCAAPGEGQRGFGSLCEWKGDGQDAKVTYVWDPQAARAQPSAPWLPRARRAMTRGATACVPVSLAVEVIDKAGHVYSEIGSLPLPSECGERAIDRLDDARVLYLDPLVPPRAPTARGKVEDRGWPPVYGPDPLDGAIVWRDRSNNEDGFRIYARRSWLETDCSISDGRWQLVTTLAPNKERYRPNHKKVVKAIKVPKIEGVPGHMNRWEYAVSAFNEAGETRLLPVGGFVGGSERFCDPGLVPPPELEP